MQVRLDSGELTQFSRRLGRMTRPEIRRRLNSELRVAATPLVPAIRASVMATPSRQQGPRKDGRLGLRILVAKTVTLQVKTAERPTVRVFMDARKMPSRFYSLPNYLEGRKRPWRHPTYGRRHRGDWKNQRAHPYFARGIKDAESRTRAAVQRVANDIARELG